MIAPYRYNGLSYIKKWLRMALGWLEDEVVALQGFYKGWREGENVL